MEFDRFDAMTRALSSADSRRRTLRALGGLLIGGVAAKLGLAEEVEAKKRGRHQADRKRSSQLHATGKKHKKHKKKDKDKPRKPAPCGAEQYACPDGSCISLDQCCPGEKKCPDGTCTKSCCVGENQCDDGTCLPGGQCCPEERRCPDGWCLRRDLCCPGEKLCGDDCIPTADCCPLDPQPLCDACEEIECLHGRWECTSTCQFYDSVCCQGQCLQPCSGGGPINPETCECECPIPAPTCGTCELVACVDGTWECNYTPESFEDCGDRACCPTFRPGWVCHQDRCCFHHETGNYACI